MATLPLVNSPSTNQVHKPRIAVTLQPVGEKDRIVSIDVLRGFAFLGILPMWLKHFLFGPLEWPWQSLTYWQWEPFRRYTSQVGDAQPRLT
jgi:uncharacterized membrane protein YeiB